MPALTIAQLAELCEGTVEGDPARIIVAANTLEDASEHDLSFVAAERLREAALRSRAGGLIVSDAFAGSGSFSLIRVRDPRAAFVRALQVLYPEPHHAPGIHPNAVIASSARLGAGCTIGPHVTIGERTEVGPGCIVGDGSFVGDDVRIGAASRLHPRVTIYARVQLGERVVVHSGAVIGADGFGFTFVQDHYEKFPQVGTVLIEDDAEIGANCCIDRAALGVTRIGAGTKLDNLVHIAHNCAIGKHVVIAAQAGFSGSVRVGDYAAIGGQAGVGEKASIAAKAIVGGKAGILTSARVASGEPVWGIPARPLRQHLKTLANMARLPELRDQVLELKRRLEKVEMESGSGGKPN